MNFGPQPDSVEMPQPELIETQSSRDRILLTNPTVLGHEPQIEIGEGAYEETKRS